MVSIEDSYEGGMEGLRTFCWQKATSIRAGVHVVALPMIQSQSAIFQVHPRVSSTNVLSASPDGVYHATHAHLTEECLAERR